MKKDNHAENQKQSVLLTQASEAQTENTALIKQLMQTLNAMNNKMAQQDEAHAQLNETINEIKKLLEQKETQESLNKALDALNEIKATQAKHAELIEKVNTAINEGDNKKAHDELKALATQLKTQSKKQAEEAKKLTSEVLEQVIRLNEGAGIEGDVLVDVTEKLSKIEAAQNKNAELIDSVKHSLEQGDTEQALTEIRSLILFKETQQAQQKLRADLLNAATPEEVETALFHAENFFYNQNKYRPSLNERLTPYEEQINNSIKKLFLDAVPENVNVPQVGEKRGDYTWTQKDADDANALNEALNKVREAFKAS